MAKAKENVQALVLRATNQNGLARRQGVNNWGGKLTRAEELVLAEMQKRGILIDGEGQISVQIIDQVCQIMQHMGIGFAETARHHGQLASGLHPVFRRFSYLFFYQRRRSHHSSAQDLLPDEDGFFS